MSSLTQILEGPRLEACINIKLDTSLENDLEIERDNSIISSCSQTAECKDSIKTNCCFNKVVAYEGYYSCFNCGAFVSENGVKTFKSNRMNYVPFFPTKTIYETMTRRSPQYKESANLEYSQIRQVYIEWILELADKLRISANSTHLAVLLLDTVMYKDSSLTPKLQLYAPVCLLIAAKAIELDERIPFIPKLRRYANPTFSVDDYRKAELNVMDMIDWNPQFSSALEISEFFMCQGFLFSSDQVEENIVSLDRVTLMGLRENIHRDNMYFETKEKTPSKSKENQENSFSDASTNLDNTLTSHQTGNMISQQIGDISPLKYTYLIPQKQHSTPANFETTKSDATSLVAVQDKVDDILTYFEANYIKLSTQLLKDIAFIAWEPRIISAAMLTFFRSVNKVTPIWNENLEIITQLNFLQISECYDLIYKKYRNVFSPNNHKVLSVIPTLENQREISLDLKLSKPSSNFSDKSGCIQPKTELVNKTNLFGNTFNDQKILDRKPTNASRNYVPVTNLVSSIASTQMRDDLRLKTRYANGTINTELPARNSEKNPTAIRYGNSQETVENCYNNIIANSNITDDSCYTNGVYPSIAYLNTRPNIPLENEPPQQMRINLLTK